MTDTTTTTPVPSKELMRLAPELDRLARLGTWLAAAESPNPTETERAAAAALRLAYAESLELPLLAATELSVIKGRLVVSAQLLRALAERQGYRLDRTEYSDKSCTAKLLRDGDELGEVTFTIDDAKRAGLIRDRSAWTTHPARMLWARASANVIKDFAPAVALGLVTEEEAREIAYNREQDTAVRANIVIGPEVEGEPRAGRDSPGAVTEEAAPSPSPPLEDEPPQDRIYVDEPVGSQPESEAYPYSGMFTAPTLTEADRKKRRRQVYALITKLDKSGTPGLDKEAIHAAMGLEYGTENVTELTDAQIGNLVDRLTSKERELGL